MFETGNEKANELRFNFDGKMIVLLMGTNSDVRSDIRWMLDGVISALSEKAYVHSWEVLLDPLLPLAYLQFQLGWQLHLFLKKKNLVTFPMP